MATRNLTDDLKTALAGTSIKPLLFVELEFASQTYRFWNGRNSKTWDSKTWLGAGFLLRIDEHEESGSDGATELKVVFAGASLVVPSIVLNERQQNRKGRFWFGLEESGSVVADPYLFFVGYLNTVEMPSSSDTYTVTIAYRSRAEVLDRASGQRLTSETQQIYYPEDVGFNHMPAIENWSGFWGRSD